MNNKISGSDIRGYLNTHLEGVFETMLSLKASANAGLTDAVPAGERITGCVGLAGETVTGSVYLHISAPFAEQATITMLGLPPEEPPGPAEVNDVVGELTNTLSGGLKSWLCDAEAVCKLTPPTVIRGNSFAVSPKAGVELVQIAFEAGLNHGLIEVHVKLS